MNIKLNHFNELDGIRALAALMVMFFHFFTGIEAEGTLFKFLQKFSVFGQTGVSLFFVLSGFLITRILINTKDSPNFFLNFYFRRTVRIFPLYYLFLILYFFVIPFVDNTRLIPFHEQFYFWIYLQNIAFTFNWNIIGPPHYWSLAVEEHFYLFWPILVYFLNKNGIKLATFVIILFAIITRIILVNNNFGVFYFTLARIDELALGALLAILEINGKLIPKNTNKFLILMLIVLIPIMVLLLLANIQGSDFAQIIKFTLVALCYFGLIGWIITTNNSNFFKKIFKSSFLSYTGKISYGLYVYHPLCFDLLKKHTNTNNVFLYFLLSFFTVFAVASLSYYAFESRFLHLKKYFQYRYLKGINN